VCANQETILIGVIFFRISGNKKAYTQLKQLVLFHVRKHSAALRALRDAWRGLPRHREVQHLAAFLRGVAIAGRRGDPLDQFQSLNISKLGKLI